MPISRAVLCALVAALSLVACSLPPQGKDVIAQAAPGGQIAFDVVKIDESVLSRLRAQARPAFDDRFKRYIPPPALKIAVGDTLSVIIWESGADGLFGNSLTELSFPAGASAAARLGQASALAGLSEIRSSLTASPDLLAALFGGASTQPDVGETRPAQPPLGIPDRDKSPFATTEGRQVGFGGIGPPDTTTGSRAGLDSSFPPTETPSERDLAAAKARRSAHVEQLLDLAEQSGRPGTRIPDQQVGPDGAISVPYAGRIKVAGRTPAEVQQAIGAALGPQALDPQALVVVRRSAANSVSVAGEVVGGRRVALSPGGDRLLQVIAAAGGAHAPAHETFVRLSRGGATATVPLAALVADPAQDIFAEPGDVLTLVRRRQTFSVFGATGKNTAISFTSDHLSLAEALAKAGGLLDNRADPRSVFLFRYEPASLVRALGQPIASDAPDGLSPVVYRLDLKEAKSYLLAKEFPVRDKDIIFVADAEIEPFYKFVRVLSKVAGPVTTGILTCFYAHC